VNRTASSACGSHDFGRAGRTARFGLLLLLVAQPALAGSQIDCSIEGACCFPRKSPRTTRVPEPRLATITTSDLVGARAKPAVKRVLGDRGAALGACTSARGVVTAHLVVAPSGSVAVSNVVAKPPVGHAIEATAVAACATDALHATTFPPAPGVTELDVRIVW